MKGIKKIIEYLNDADEVKSFEESYDVEFPESESLEVQIQFVRYVENEHYDSEELDREERRHILYYLLLAQLEVEQVRTHLTEVQEFLSYFKDKDIDLPNTFNGRDDISGRNRNLLN